jgi:hypothetical protein
MSHKKLLYGSLIVVCIVAVVSIFMLGNGAKVSAGNTGYGADCRNCDDQFRACTQRCDNSTVTANKSQCYNKCNEAYNRCMTLCKCTMGCQKSFQECMKKATTATAKETCRENYLKCKQGCYEQVDHMGGGQRLIE